MRGGYGVVPVPSHQGGAVPTFAVLPCKKHDRLSSEDAEDVQSGFEH